MQGPQNSQVLMIDPLDSLNKPCPGAEIEDQKAGKVISESNKDWLNGEGNLVNEKWVVQDLEGTSNYERVLGSWGEGRGIVQKLQVLGGGHSAGIGCPYHTLPYNTLF